MPCTRGARRTLFIRWDPPLAFGFRRAKGLRNLPGPSGRFPGSWHRFSLCSVGDHEHRSRGAFELLENRDSAAEGNYQAFFAMAASTRSAAATARWWLRNANSSCAWRLTSNSLATFSAVRPMFM